MMRLTFTFTRAR